MIGSPFVPSRLVIHHLHFTQFIAAEPAVVWNFFATPDNLNLLTPPELHFQTLTDPERMYAGQMIAYRLRLLPGIHLRWLTEITQVREPGYFVDEQRIGPYKLWHHEHRFTPKNGGVEMTDKVTYALPFAGLGEVVHRLWVRRTLGRIFAYRREKITARFGV